MSVNGVGEYLRARRELVRPDEAGIPDSGRRRVPGLRRDELALLAGISTEYYTRLEQGSDHHPSGQVLDAIARALRLDADATAHLHELAAPTPARRRRARRPEQVNPSVRQLLNSWHTNPAFVQGRFLDVLAANPLMTALSPMYTPGRNILRAAFLDSAVSDLFCDADVRLENVVSALRASVGPDVDDPQLTDLIGELSLKSSDFRRLWARHDVKPPRRHRRPPNATIAADQQHPAEAPTTSMRIPTPPADAHGMQKVRPASPGRGAKSRLGRAQVVMLPSQQ